MTNKPDVVQIKMDKSFNPQTSAPTKAFQVSVDDKTVIVYNRIQGYILDSLIKAIFK
ncbi:MAG: hypothetical protein ABF991_12105 [Liquorilactobacillus hordei]|uniref:hypothetical protein n=1 Tax=Lactobacillaceae TaxID=33958 RepID=UPI001CC20895|nr:MULTISPECIES: hypothetical protein [Lactobacillaceae]MCP9313725.1 hypothetical protein [Liquorilactobacillus satsumensis]MCP9360866.1 hypothetical protein [Liquorilactobacillus satsumensis]